MDRIGMAARRRRATSLILGSIAAAAIGLTAIGVTQGAAPPSKGGMPHEAFDEHGRVNEAIIPDFIFAYDRKGGIAGWIPRRYLITPELAGGDMPVFADDLKTRVGTMVPRKGFVPQGTDPRDIPSSDVQTIAE